MSGAAMGAVRKRRGPRPGRPPSTARRRIGSPAGPAAAAAAAAVQWEGGAEAAAGGALEVIDVEDCAGSSCCGDLAYTAAAAPSRMPPHAASAHAFDDAEVRLVRERLLGWYDAKRRDLPWRKQPVSPYATWVSEVMCQQTRVDTVVPFFTKWMLKFPTVDALARASGDEVRACASASAWGRGGGARSAAVGTDAPTTRTAAAAPAAGERCMGGAGLL